MTTPAAPPRRRARLGWAVMLFLGAVVAMVLWGMASWNNPLTDLFGGEEFVDRGPVVVQSVRNLSELTTVEVVESTTIESGTDTGLLNFATGDRIFLFAVARISAGVDLGQVGPDDVVINEAANSITLTLPSPTITAVEMDNEQTRVYDRDTGLFTSGDMDLEREARLAAEDLMVEAAIQDGIRERARESSQLAMEELLTSLGYDQVIIRFAPAD
ncbi:MAG TPA: DUF4230 domain-containing protein, partial [Nitriliruptoraceae bacterium]|nr:DUF4230 domain-containing protein [Nitriliruptoraceae bacterium]